MTAAAPPEVVWAWLVRAPLWPSSPARTTSDAHVQTEETQYGWAARLGSVLFPNRMSRFHQIWLERLAEKALSGHPPAA